MTDMVSQWSQVFQMCQRLRKNYETVFGSNKGTDAGYGTSYPIRIYVFWEDI